MDIKATIHLSDSDIVQLIERFGAAALGGPINLPEPIPPAVSYDDETLPTPQSEDTPAIVPGTHVDVTHTFTSAPPVSDKDLKAMLRRHLGKFHHIIPIDGTINKLADDIKVLLGHGKPTVQIRGGHSRSDTNRVVVKGLSLARAVASHWESPHEGKRFTRFDVQNWLHESGHNPSSAQGVLGYLEGAGIVVVVGRVLRKDPDLRYFVYEWGRRMQDDEDIHCHGPTGLETVRRLPVPVVAL